MKPEYKQPHHDHGHLPVVGSSPGHGYKDKGLGTASHGPKCGIGCRNALLGTFGAIAVLGGLALLVWWLLVKRKRKNKKTHEEDGMELNTDMTRGSNSNTPSQSINLGKEEAEKESQSSFGRIDPEPPRVELTDRGSFELPQVLMATEVTGRASPVIIDVPPRSPRSESGSSEEKGGSSGSSGSSTTSSSRRFSSVHEEDCVQSGEEGYYTPGADSVSSHSRRSSRAKSEDQGGEGGATGEEYYCLPDAAWTPSISRRGSCAKSYRAEIGGAI